MRIIRTLIIIFCVLLRVQLTYCQLNIQIDESQKVAISKSPFKTAKGIADELSRQTKIRPEYLAIIDSLRKEFPQDTILLTESYSFICSGCPSNYIEIQIDDNLISLERNLSSKNYIRKTERLTKYCDKTGYYHSDIHELRIEINKSENWNANPEKYGTENCFDGGHTFYTVIYPGNKILSMYMRCWINKERRKSNE